MSGGPNYSNSMYSNGPGFCDQLGFMFQAWLRSLGLASVLLTVAVVLAFIPSMAVIAYIPEALCLIPANFLNYKIGFSLWTVLTYAFVSTGPFQLLFTVFILLFMAAAVERLTGTLHFLFCLVVTTIITGSIVVLIGWAFAFVPYVGTYLFNSCNVGISGFMFTSLVMLIGLANLKKLIFCYCIPMPSHVFVWVMFILFQIISLVTLSPFNTSWAGELAGIIVGYLYFFGPMRWIVPDRLFIFIENKLPFLERIPLYVKAKRVPKTGPLDEFRTQANNQQQPQQRAGIMGMNVMNRSRVVQTGPYPANPQPRRVEVPNQPTWVGRGRTLAQWESNRPRSSGSPGGAEPFPRMD
ncbi:Rhomboid family [Carpediemonas membranifera]|uniref:Rhomboid family n=1 Tax=Carpediemonas membranifera TaxID=201153 RepID=A0A8J6BTL4_9EUKA|nr:Rhomboid family [Carpediemonas membranifera]|eukprot:KAG9389481.1 Rhomboid family [Carpediemonas membranifera]